jgi:transcriptional regulator with XRE-family HTH domain
MAVTRLDAPADREHGTRACYARGCRCDPCRGANRASERHRERQILYGRWEPYVDATPAREHVRMLGRHGLGHRRVSDLAGISNGVMSKLLYGIPGRPPSRRIRSATEAAILAVTPRAGLAPSAAVDATGTRRRLQALVACGWSQARLAARLGMTLQNFISMLTQERVKQSTRGAVCALYDELWNTAPEEKTRWDRTAATRARNMAAARGWVPPLAWDEDVIDDPSGEPASDWKRGKFRRAADLVADCAELEGRGYSREHAAERLGVTRDALDAAIYRVRKQEQQREAAA